MKSISLIRPIALGIIAALGFPQIAVPATGAITVAQAPLLSSNPDAVNPNLFYILDDSGSMDWDFLPDWINYNASGGGIGSYCKTSNTTGTNTTCCVSASNSNQCMDVSATDTPVSRRGMPPFTNGDINGVYYNPSVTYLPPLDYKGVQQPNITNYTAVPVDGYGIQSSFTLNLLTSYPDLEYCTDGTFANCLRNDNYLLPGVVAGSTYNTAHMTDVSHVSGVSSATADFASGTPDAPTVKPAQAIGPYYYIIVPGEYCTSKKLSSCSTSYVPTGGFTVPARLRWCTAAGLATCQAQKTTTLATNYQFPRYPGILLSLYGYAKASITSAVAANASFVISSIKANGYELLASPITCSSSSSSCSTSSNTASVRNGNVARAIQNAIAANSSTTQFNADANGTVVNITAPAGTAYNSKALTINNGTTPTGLTVGNLGKFDNSGSASGVSVPGYFKRIDIVSGQTYGSLWTDSTGALYSSGGTGRTLVLDRSGRTDCSGGVCSYAQEMTNFANWYAYYHTRMQMTKTSISRAFSSLANNKYNVGLFTINSGAVAKSISGSSPNRYSNNRFLDIANWDDTQREYFYNTLFRVNPSGGTPLRNALSKAGLIFAHKLNGAADPMQESCQQNFAILSTDGYWNGAGGTRILANGTTTSMDDEDGSAPRPYLDAGGTPDTLADTAYFYYNTDLRQGAFNNCVSGQTGHDTCENNVRTALNDASPQSMITFTIGLGANGVMQYRDGYWGTSSIPNEDRPDDFAAVESGVTANSASGVCLWQANGSVCSWPTPVGDTPTAIDDLWHAAVNGHGQYVSAKNPKELSTGLLSALGSIKSARGAGAAATSSSPNISPNSNSIVTSYYYYQSNGAVDPPQPDWYSDLILQTVNASTGAISGTAWRAQPTLDSLTSASATSSTAGTSGRKIWMYSSYYSNNLKPFTWSTLTPSDPLSPGDLAQSCGSSKNEQACFTAAYANLSQYCASGIGCLTADQQSLAPGRLLVEYLRGDRYNENPANDNGQLYRIRSHLLGDIVNSEAVYVKNAPFIWDETLNPGYTSFYNAVQTRPATVYVTANDGMLHAFDASSGVERWAYIPSMVLPKLYQLADFNYSHQYYVNGSPVVGNASISGGWKTILVGGLDGGGVGYYALDVTDPSTPKGLWEFKQRSTNCGSSPVGKTDDCDLGYSFGNPVITKYCTSWSSGATMSGDVPIDGNCASYVWAVIVTSGTDNVSPGTGGGYLYVLNAATGAIIKKFATNVGNTTTPSNLGRINVRVNDISTDNAATVVYGGDMQGNLWRFNLLSGNVSRMISLGDTQPITAKPMVGIVSGKYHAVYFPTGRLMSSTSPYDDLGDTNQKGFYGLWDKDDGATWTVSQLSRASVSCDSSGACNGTVGAANVFGGSGGGWYLYFTQSGERSYTDPQIAFGAVIFTSAWPGGNACKPNGSGRLWALDYASGGAPGSSSKVAVATDGMSPRPAVVSVGGQIEVILPTDSGGAEPITSGNSGLSFSKPVPGWGASCAEPCQIKASRHAIWRLLSD